jgi:uncharacterized repeat protein (TIGR03806 family)
MYASRRRHLSSFLATRHGLAGACQMSRRTQLRLEGRWLGFVVACFAGPLGCGSPEDAKPIFESRVGDPGERPAPFLGLPPAATTAPRANDAGEIEADGFPLLLSETGAFDDVVTLTPRAGLVPYDIQSPLWSDGALKRRWMSLPEGTELGYSEHDPFVLPEGTVFVKHFEMALDERQPDVRHRLETRLWVVGARNEQYGVSYQWNEAQTDAELSVASATNELSIIDADGNTRTQAYYYPGSSDCFACHNERANYVLGVRARQLNRDFEYRAEVAPVNQLVAWSGWRLIDAEIDNTAAALSPRLVPVNDENVSLEDRVRSYWDGNCSMCHAGSSGSVPGWDARFDTPFADQGLIMPPRNGTVAASQLITPGDPEQSFIYQRGDTVERGLSMPPLGRNTVDATYVGVLTDWIASLQ